MDYHFWYVWHLLCFRVLPLCCLIFHFSCKDLSEQDWTGFVKQFKVFFLLSDSSATIAKHSWIKLLHFLIFCSNTYPSTCIPALVLASCFSDSHTRCWGPSVRCPAPCTRACWLIRGESCGFVVWWWWSCVALVHQPPLSSWVLVTTRTCTPLLSSAWH